MSRHLEKILANADRQLAGSAEVRPTESLPQYQKFLRIEEHRLRLKHRAGGGGREIAARRSDLVDVLLERVFDAATAHARRDHAAVPLSLIALGGYGRGELNPFSDVDVMFLYGGNGETIAPFVSETVEQVLYLLWDIGFKVGHSTRSIKEAIAQANQDMLTKTAMLESRHLAGHRELARQFRKQFRARCVVGFEKQYIELRMRDQAERHAKFGNNVYRQEPNVKSGCGGLRDYQNLLWMTYFKEGALTTTHLVGRDWLSKPEQRRIDAAYDFLLRVRTQLHYLAGRGSDVLHLGQQEELARKLGYEQATGVQRNEIFMKDYYGHTRNIFRISERITEQFASGFSSGRVRALFSFLPRARAERKPLGDFFARHGKLHLAKADGFRRDSTLMMRAFRVAQEHDLDLSPELADLFARHLSSVTRTYQYAKGPREIFLEILSRKGKVARALRAMHRVDFLGRYLPEFGQLTCLVQHEFFHRYTADEHTLVCIDKLDALIGTEEPKLIPYRKLFEQIEDPAVLYLALLLHDTGRAVGARPHSEASAVFAQRVASRLQLSPEQRKSLILLVDHHVTLSNIARQRNLDDPETIREFAGLVKNQHNLDLLMLLTLADGQGTSAEAWSDWKESLVWHLYEATRKYLINQRAFHEEAKIARETLSASVRSALSSDFADEIEAHFDFMPDNYFRAFSVRDIVSHLRIARSFFEQIDADTALPLAPGIRWEAFPERGHSIVAFFGWDRPQFLTKIVGALAVVPLNILSADTYLRGDSLILHVFHVCTIDGQAVSDDANWQRVHQTLYRSLMPESFEIEPSSQPTQPRHSHRHKTLTDFPTAVIFDNKAHPNYTLIEIETPDRLGLLFDLLSCLDGVGVEVALARVSTEKGAAHDTFYAAEASTRYKIMDHARIGELQEKLLAAALP